MSNMIAEYFKEMQHYETLEMPEKGFIMWHKYGNDELHLAHMYVRPEFRRQGLAQELYKRAEALGREMGCKYATCIVTLADKTRPQASRLVRIYMESGFFIDEVYNNNQVILRKDLI